MSGAASQPGAGGAPLRPQEPAQPEAQDDRPCGTLDAFFSEAERLNLTAEALAPHLAARPEFADCLAPQPPEPAREPSDEEIELPGPEIVWHGLGYHAATTIRPFIAERIAEAQRGTVNACNETGRVFREMQEWRQRAEDAEAKLAAAVAAERERAVPDGYALAPRAMTQAQEDAAARELTGCGEDYNDSELRGYVRAAYAAAIEAALAQPEAERQQGAETLHARIMNLPCNDEHANEEWSDRRGAYQAGHRDARHAAAEMVLAMRAEPSGKTSELTPPALCAALSDPAPVLSGQQRAALIGLVVREAERVAARDAVLDAAAEAAELQQRQAERDLDTPQPPRAAEETAR